MFYHRLYKDLKRNISDVNYFWSCPLNITFNWGSPEYISVSYLVYNLQYYGDSSNGFYKAFYLLLSNRNFHKWTYFRFLPGEQPTYVCLKFQTSWWRNCTYDRQSSFPCYELPWYVPQAVFCEPSCASRIGIEISRRK